VRGGRPQIFKADTGPFGEKKKKKKGTKRKGEKRGGKCTETEPGESVFPKKSGKSRVSNRETNRVINLARQKDWGTASPNKKRRGADHSIRRKYQA